MADSSKLEVEVNERMVEKMHELKRENYGTLKSGDLLKFEADELTFYVRLMGVQHEGEMVVLVMDCNELGEKIEGGSSAIFSETLYSAYCHDAKTHNGTFSFIENIQDELTVTELDNEDMFRMLQAQSDLETAKTTELFAESMQHHASKALSKEEATNIARVAILMNELKEQAPVHAGLDWYAKELIYRMEREE